MPLPDQIRDIFCNLCLAIDVIEEHNHSTGGMEIRWIYLSRLQIAYDLSWNQGTATCQLFLVSNFSSASHSLARLRLVRLKD